MEHVFVWTPGDVLGVVTVAITGGFRLVIYGSLWPDLFRK